MKLNDPSVRVAKRRDLRKRLIHLYYDNGWTQAKIAEHYHVSVSAVARWFKAFDLRGRDMQDAWAIRKGSKPAATNGCICECDGCRAVHERAPMQSA